MASKRKDSKGKVLRKGETQRKDGTYMYRWGNPAGKREYVYAQTLADLRELEQEIEKEMVMGVCRKSYTLNEQIERYLKTKVKLADSTSENYKYYFEHITKDSPIGRAKVVDIRKSDILIFYHSLTEHGLSAGTIKIIHKIIRPALQLACDDDVIMKNPADGCTREYTEELEKKYALTFEEEKEFLDRIKMRPRMQRYYPMYAIMLNTGLRISESVGLTWNDVDMEKKEIHVNHQVQYRKVQGRMKLYANTTKTSAGKRVILMVDKVYSLFVEQRKVWLMTDKASDFAVDGYKDFVFVSHMTGKCMSHNTVRRMMRTIVSMNSEREIQLPNISPHILRHTACCRLAESGCDIKVLQYLMGQTDIRTTMGVYNHVDVGRVKREMSKLKTLDCEEGIFTPNFTPFSRKVM